MPTPDFDVEFWKRIWKAVQRLLGAAAVEYWSSVGLNVAFLVIYALLLSEMIEVLIWWRRR
jgi:hypothetical protein